MRIPRVRHVTLSLATSVAVLSFAASALAQQDQCPPGSTWKTSNDVGWCEPSVCDSDAQCSTGDVCRPVPLCVEIGKLDPKAADAGTTLMARQKCGPDKSCPQSTVCSDKTRCLSKSAAEKMGVLAPAGSAQPASAPLKSSCGCDVPGGSSPADAAALFAFAGLLAVTVRRRGRQPTRP